MSIRKLRNVVPLLCLALAGVSGIAAANDVTVGTVDPSGNLAINGDQDANDVTITESGGSITITGNGTTTVNGMNSVTITPPPTVKKLTIKLRGGDDILTLDGVDIDDVNISDKIGNNSTTVKNGNVKNTLRIRHGPGDDTVNVTNQKRGHDNIKTDGGRDDVNISSGSSQRSVLRTQGGSDVVNFVDTTISNLTAITGPGDDEVFVSNSAFDRTKFQGGSGENCLIDSGTNDFGSKSKILNFDPDACDGEDGGGGGSEMRGRAVTLDFDTGDLPAGTVLCLDEIAEGGCVFTGPECVDADGEAPHLHGFIEIESMPGTFFEDPNSPTCGHGIVEEDVLDCGPDDVPSCLE